MELNGGDDTDAVGANSWRLQAEVVILAQLQAVDERHPHVAGERLESRRKIAVLADGKRQGSVGTGESVDAMDHFLAQEISHQVAKSQRPRCRINAHLHIVVE